MNDFVNVFVSYLVRYFRVLVCELLGSGVAVDICCVCVLGLVGGVSADFCFSIWQGNGW